MDDVIGSIAEDINGVSGSELGKTGGGRGGGVTTDGDRIGGVTADGDKLRGAVTVEGRIEEGRGGVTSDGDRIGGVASESDKFEKVAADDGREGNIEGGRGGGLSSDGDKLGEVMVDEDTCSVAGVATDDDKEGRIEGGRGGGVSSDGDKLEGVGGTGEDITSCRDKKDSYTTGLSGHHVDSILIIQSENELNIQQVNISRKGISVIRIMSLHISGIILQ
uniref:Uncharacterized protein n=1 Tax=Amphimedon queenslandica TaxID=400682 RepID=A0A1X7UX38_AMPQE